ncbi:MAG: ABC transporter permease [Clostridia bacterium]|nr:ABC transporter permease [Clostridia bacterium]
MQTKIARREPLFHISKNDAMPFGKALAIRICAILAALLVVGILSMILIKENPLLIYMSMFEGAFIDVWTLFQNTALLLIFGLAVIPAFQMKFWNLGANGQVLAGCLAAIACMKFLPEKYPEISNTVLILIMAIASILASCIWSVVPAIFKAYFNTNETLFTLMMNYIALALVDYCVFTWDKTGSGNLGIVNLLNGRKGWIPDISNKYILSIIVAVVLTAFMFIYMKYTKHGFEVSLVGESVNTAKYVGIDVKKVIIRTLLLGGLICGILGFLYAGSVSHTINKEVGGLGFTAILVAWLANFDSLVMLLTSFFVVFLDAGSKYVSTQFQLNSNDYANIVVGIIFFFVIGCEFFIRFKIQFNNKKTSNNERVGE